MINVEYAEPSVFPVLESIRLITNEVDEDMSIIGAMKGEFRP
ncbi:unnamed protein product, partial [marine sediment metagenome]